MWLGIRDVKPDEKNPWTAEEILEMVKEGPLKELIEDGKVLPTIIPDIESINYGRGVGYDIIEHVPPQEIGEISATSIREQMKKMIRTWCILSIVFLFLSVVLMTSFIGESSTKSSQGKVLFYGQNMLGTWDIPVYGKYGREAFGMFGLLPIYLSSSNYDCEIVVDNITKFIDKNQPDILINNTLIGSNQTELISIQRYTNLTDYVSIKEAPTITTDLLDDIDVFVVINLNNSFSEVEKDIIWDFVADGGIGIRFGYQPISNFFQLADVSHIGGILDAGRSSNRQLRRQGYL